MHNTDARTEHRIRRFIVERLEPQRYLNRVPLQLTSWDVPDEPVSFTEATSHDFTPFTVGTTWSRPWGTTWFRATGQVPADWAAIANTHAELVIDLGFRQDMPGFQAEATAWTPQGSIIKGIEPFNDWVPVAGAEVDIFIEAASNPVFSDGGWITPTPLGDKATAGTDPLYTFRAADIALLDEQVDALFHDVTVLAELMVELPESSTRRHQILAALEDMMNTVDPFDLHSTAAQGRAVLANVLGKPAHASAHEVYAVGHAHIDSAWLWPTRETRRKCARTFSNVLALMDIDPDATFACSSAQQYAWIQQDYPELFERIKQRVAEGRFVPVGGMWVESDTNLPGGEATVRQFLQGTRYFIDELGVEPTNVWLPDSFGYSGALPQIARLAGKTHFLTQKISWNDTNVFPHHTFWWEGIDGSRIYTHFPPVDTYNAEIRAFEMAKSERQFREKGHSTKALMPFGYGDGGGGPTREMMQRAHRTADLEGSPKVVLSTPDAFFHDAQDQYPNPSVWRGELYLEYHRGTYTSQHETKRGNRECEHLLREAELWCTAATIHTGADYPYAELQEIWRIVLLQQFHDILPGSSIAWVAHDAEANYDAMRARLSQLIDDAISALAGKGTKPIAFNASPFSQAGVPALGAGVPALGAGVPHADTATISGGVIDTEALTAVIDTATGRITSLRDKTTGRDLVPEGADLGALVLHQDIPNEWDAWDINHFYKDMATHFTPASVHEDAGGVEVRYVLPNSTITQVIKPDPHGIRVVFDIDWHEQQMLLKWYLPAGLKSQTCASEIQFGHIQRPTHSNTSWDQARFETVAHRWLHVGEGDDGFWVANSSTYGWDVSSQSADATTPITQVGASLVRGPKFPDPEADQTRHHLEFVIGTGDISRAIEAGYAVNLPVRQTTGSGDAVDPLVTVSDQGVVVEAIKLAEDQSGDVIVRLYEALGRTCTATLTCGFPSQQIDTVDLLERALTPGITADAKNDIELQFHPFQIQTLRIKRP